MIDVDRISDRLACDPLVTDYDFWRAIKELEYELYAVEQRGGPVPIEFLRLRRIMHSASRKHRSRSQ